MSLRTVVAILCLSGPSTPEVAKRVVPTAALVLALFASACSTSPSGPSGPSPLVPPPPIAGTWVSEVNDIRIRLDLTETPFRMFGTVLTSTLSVEGSGTLTSLSSGESVRFEASGLNQTDTLRGGVQQVLINFFVQPPLYTGLYGYFNGAIRGSTLAGTIQNDSGNSIGPFFGPQSVTVVFSRP